MEEMKDALRAQLDELFIKVRRRLGKILNQINALEYRVCALEDNPMKESDLPDAVKQISAFANEDSPKTA